MENNLLNAQEIANIFSLFEIEGEYESSKVLTAGNINATYMVTMKSGDVATKYILQRVNNYVFKEPWKIMSNIELVTKEIKAKASANEQTLVFYNTKDGKNYYVDDKDNFYRICNFIDSLTIDASEDLEVLKALGLAFGDFQNKLSDFDAAKLYDTIPDFHNTKKRIEKLLASIEKDEFDRCKDASDAIAFVKENLELACKLSNMLEAGEIPLRVTHNDTKINNVLFDKVTKMPIAIIDLDTVMPGLSVHDYGDAVRFACSTAAEDEKDTSKVAIDLDKFRAFSDGFVTSTKDKLSKIEIDSLVLGAITITIELGVRFLDDYLTGDKYFKTLYPGHNLVRTNCQFALAKSMLDNKDTMENIIKEL